MDLFAPSRIGKISEKYVGIIELHGLWSNFKKRAFLDCLERIEIENEIDIPQDTIENLLKKV